MSATLSRLRSALGDPLLVRSGRGLKRTLFADSLREPLAHVLHDIELLIESGGAFDPATARRTFTIVASDYVSLVLLRPLIERLETLAPHVTVRVEPISTELLDHLRRGLVDLVIYPAELLPLNAPFQAELLFEDDFVCASDVGNNAIKDQMSMEQLSQLPYLASGSGVLASLADMRLDEAGIVRNTVMVTQAFLVAPFLIGGTQMFTITPRRLAKLLAPAAGIRILEPPMPIATLHEHMVWTPHRGADAAHSWLRDQLKLTAQLIN